MQTVLVISSFVAASRIGATASAFCLRRLGHEAIILPTTLMGRHPGWGAPGGGAVEADRLRDMWDAIKAQNIKFDAVLTGYMGQAEHIPLAAEIISYIKSVNPQAYILVDPVMGDFGIGHSGASNIAAADNIGGASQGKLYIPEARARAICDILVPLADIITPNLWELSYIAGEPLAAAQDALIALGRLSQSAIVTSVPFENEIGKREIGALLYDGEIAAQSHHEKFARVPHGGGDSLAGIYLGHYLRGDTPRLAMRKSVSALFQIMSLAHSLNQQSQDNMSELPLIQAQDVIINSPPLDFIELYL